MWRFQAPYKLEQIYEVEEDSADAFELGKSTEWLSRDLKEQEDISQKLSDVSEGSVQRATYKICSTLDGHTDWPVHWFWNLQQLYGALHK